MSSTRASLRGLTLSLLVSGSLVVACADDATGSSVTPDAACEAAASAICDKLEECAPFLATAGFTDRAACVARFEINCVPAFSATGTSATPARASECARELRAATCDSLLGRTPPEVCRTLPGTLEDGAVCGLDAQCKNKLCRIAKGSTCGACSALGDAGSACARQEDCEYGLTCVADKCIAFGKVGNACASDQPCQPLLACTNGVCATPIAAGAACTFKLNENPCDAAAGFYCHPVEGKCVAVGTSTAGGACELSLERVTACVAGSECKRNGDEARGTCMAPAADGATCNDAGGPKCQAPARCVNGICTITDPATCK